MTEALLPSGYPLRTLPSEIGTVVPVVDIADMIGYNRSSITKTIDKNEAAFEGLKTFQTLPTSGGNQWFLCLNHAGTERLFLLLSPSSKTKKDLFKRVEEFRIKAFEKMETPKEIVPVPASPDIRAELQEARELAAICGKSVESFQAVILRKHGKAELADALQAPVPFTHGESGQWMNPSEIGHECCLTAQQVNYWLLNHGFQYKDGPLWRLTPKGTDYGEEYVFEATSKHSEIRIRWNKAVMVASGLKRPELQGEIRRE